MFVAGVDGCRAGWVWFRVEVPSMTCRVSLVDICATLRNRPAELLSLAIDIPIGLFNGSRACDSAARQLLGSPRASSVFSPPCRLATRAQNYEDACNANFYETQKKISRQAWGISQKIREIDEVMMPGTQQWAFEVHPEVCFWAINNQRPMKNRKRSREGKTERLNVLLPIFPDIEDLSQPNLSGVGVDDILDAAAAAWTAIRLWQGAANSVCQPEFDELELRASIHY
jgi:predicted RNase H-like nuclease